jgi:hypothetical protein
MNFSQARLRLPPRVLVLSMGAKAASPIGIWAMRRWCFHSLSLLDNFYLHLSTALMPSFRRAETSEVNYGCNILPHKALKAFQQH